MKRLIHVIMVLGLIPVMISCATMTGRTAGQTWDDAQIVSAINWKIIKAPELAYLKINVDSFDGHVTLTGQVPSKEAGDRLVALAKDTNGVKDVKPNLEIQRPAKPTQPSTPIPYKPAPSGSQSGTGTYGPGGTSGK